MKETEKLQLLIATLMVQYERFENKESTTAQVIKAVIELANGINEMK